LIRIRKTRVVGKIINIAMFLDSVLSILMRRKLETMLKIKGAIRVVVLKTGTYESIIQIRVER